MEGFILKLLNISLTSVWVVLAVLLLRLVFRRSPKWIHCVLWGVVALRLLLPMSFESKVSMIPEAEPIRTTTVQVAPSETERLPHAADIIPDEPEPEPEPAMDIWQILGIVWVCGVAAVLLYGGISLLVLRRRVGPSIRLQERVYCCDAVDSPFILGILMPRIYLPSGLEENQIRYILEHENAHLKRKDHWWKTLAFLLLAFHWFNPAVWLAYILLCQDIEKACDEKVIHNMDDADKLGYSRTLLACSVQRRMIMACPVAFGEVSVKTRIRSVLNYRKPAFWLVMVAAVGCVAAAVCFLTDPIPCAHSYEAKLLTESTCTTQGTQALTCSKCGDSYTQYLPLQAHVYQSEDLVRAATCTADGSETCQCADCGAGAYRILPAVEHAYQPGEILEPANCVYAGLQTVVCADCGAREAIPIGTNQEHSYTTQVVRGPTCTQPGEGIRTCTRCNATENYAIPVIDHNYKDGYWIGATCQQAGYQQKICRDCGYSYYEKTSEKTDHWWIRMSGEKWCSVCHATMSTGEGNSNSGTSYTGSVRDWGLGPESSPLYGKYTPTWPAGGNPTMPSVVWDVDAVYRP